MTQQLKGIRAELQEIARAEAVKVWRLARRMEAHGCNPDSIHRARAEGCELFDTMGAGYPERLLDPFKVWEFAFR